MCSTWSTLVGWCRSGLRNSQQGFASWLRTFHSSAFIHSTSKTKRGVYVASITLVFGQSQYRFVEHFFIISDRIFAIYAVGEMAEHRTDLLESWKETVVCWHLSSTNVELCWFMWDPSGFELICTHSMDDVSYFFIHLVFTHFLDTCFHISGN